MTIGAAASRRVSVPTPLAPLPASGPKRPIGINGRTFAEPETSLPEVCSFQLPKVCSFRLPLTVRGELLGHAAPHVERASASSVVRSRP